MAAPLEQDGITSLLTGRRIGPYQLLDLLGVGGMGEVYRARDDRLGREVAVKVLPRIFSADAERLARFQREARLLASLNHPHIAAIYGVEDNNGIPALILELVEGPTLAEQLQRGPVPVAEALPIAHQIADAVEAAHEQGIVHRDLKPGNIKVKPDGTVKVLDFGLAKAAAAESLGADFLRQPSTGPTREGLILGTVNYMSPEQARGHTVDKRTDIWAFGCVLYEILTGRAAFAGETISETIAAILERDPDLSKLPATTSPGVRRVLQRCLAKDPKRRLRDIGDAHADLDDAPTAAIGDVSTQQHVFRRALPWAIILIIGIVAGSLAMWLARRPASETVPLFSRAHRLTTTPAHEFGPAISPDGKWVAYLSDARGPTDVWVKFTAGGEPANLTASVPLEIQVRSAIGGLDISPDGRSIAVQARPSGSTGTFDTWLIPAPLGGTPRRFVETSGALRWSPDGKRIVYVRPGETRGDALVVADSNGENPRDIVPARGGWHTHWPAWSADGRFVYFLQTIATWNGEPSEIVRVPASGGEPQVVVRTTRRALFPLPTADGGLVYAANPGGVDLDLWFRHTNDSVPHRLTTGVGEYAEPRMSSDGRKLVATLIEYRQALVFLPVVFAEQRQLRHLTDGFGGDVDPSVSLQTGRMVFSSSRSGDRNLWTADANGSDVRPLTADAALEERPSFSPDGRQIAFVSDRGAERGIWIVNSEGGRLRRLASTQVLDTLTWSPDGGHIAHALPGGAIPELSIVAVSDGTDRRLPTPGAAHSPAWSPRADIVAYLEPRGPGRTHVKFVNSRGEPLYSALPDGPSLTNGFLAWAPDGRRLAAVGVPGSANASIWIVEPDSPEPFRKLIELPGEVRPRSITWTRDGSSLIFGRQEALSDLVLFERVERDSR
jgi:Tol biopolymer transport system component